MITTTSNSNDDANRAATAESDHVVPTDQKDDDDNKQGKPFDSLDLSRSNVQAAQLDKSGRVFRVYCDGIFDLFHVAHMKMLQQAKNALSNPDKVYLIVGVCGDDITQQHKGKTVMSHEIRCESCLHCKWVDEVAPDAPWVIDEAFLAKYRIDFVAHDALPYADTSGQSADGDVYSYIKRRGMFLETKRTEGISTSDIIASIIRDYDALVQRNLSRGFTKQELNVGRTWQVRQAAHEKEKKVRLALLDTQRDARELTRNARAFLRPFNPEMMRRKNVMQHLRKELPVQAEGVLHHAWGLARSLTHLAGYSLSFINPFAYCKICCTRDRKRR